MLRGLVLAVGVMVVSAGCGDPTEGKPTATGTTAVTTAPSKSADPDAGLWDPCGLPDSAVSATGLDPATKRKDVAGGVKFEGWKVCAWQASAKWYDLTIFSGPPTLQDIQQRPDYEAFSPRTVGTHRGIEFFDVGDSQRLKCYVAAELPHGSVMFKVLTRPSIGKQGDPCGEARRHSADLAKYLPGS